MTNPEETLQKVPFYLDAGRLDEAERLLISVLREAQEGSPVHWDGVLTLCELYERQERFREGLILSREVPEKLDPRTALGRRGLLLRARLHTAEDEHDRAQKCLSFLSEE